MDEERQNLRQAERFDLLTNPFNILDVDLTASPEQIAAAFGAATTVRAAESDLLAARLTLMDPRRRTSVELSFLLDTPIQEVKVLLDLLKTDTSLEDLVRLADRLAPLSKANLLVHIGSRRAATANLLSALVDAHASIDPMAVFTRLEAARKTAAMAAPSFDSVRDGLLKLVSWHSKAVLSAYPTARASAKPVEECTKRVLETADPEHMAALEGIIGAFASKTAPALVQIEEQISSAAEMLRDRPDELGLIYSFASSLRRWMSLARPLVELDAHKGRDQERASQLLLEVRNLSVELADQHNRLDVALSVSNIAADVFTLLPGATEQLNEDRAALEKRSAEIRVFPLRKWIEGLAGNSAGLARDLELFGFGNSSVRETKELWNLFATAADVTQNTESADLPWMIVRRLAADINKDEQSPLAAKAIFDGLLEYAQHTAPSEKLSELIHDDLRAIERNLRKKELAEDPNADRTSPALEGIYQILADPASPEKRPSAAKPKGRREIRWPTQYVKWGAFGLVGALLLVGGIFARSSRPPNADYTGSLGQKASNQPSTDYASPASLSQTSELSIEEPPIGSGNMLSQPNIRYCLYQKERMRVMESDLRGPDEISAFNTVVADYNGRCGNFQYRETDLRIVTDEVKEKSEALAAEARNIVSGWRSGSTPQPSLATPDTPSFLATAPQIPSPPTSAGRSSSMASAGIDLLQLETAINIQRRLAELGYFRGPSNGAWGPQSRSALRAFKVANGLANDDVLDPTTAAQLRSGSAARNTAFAKMAAIATLTVESIYPPPPGATLNPLNRSDAIKIHAKLREQGFYRAAGYMLWSAASRDALREFKSSNGLGANDQWDASTEERLMSANAANASAVPATPARPAREIPAGFATATTGTWSVDPRACPGGVGGSDSLPIKITQNHAETDGARCEFENVSGLGTIWKTVGTCTVNGQTRRANISLVRTGNVLVWSSENGTTKYQRCTS
jgi:hypothetical protein